MIYFIYGENWQEAKNRLDEIEADFRKLDPSGINLEKVEGESLTHAKFIQAVTAAPFLAEKRLTIIRNLLNSNQDAVLKDKIAAYLLEAKKSGASNDLVFFENGQPDKRQKLFKELIKNSQTFEAIEPKGGALIRWIINTFKEEGIDISPFEAQEYVFLAGSETLKLSNEIKKIALYLRSKNEKTACLSQISDLISAEIDPNIFQFTEAVIQKNSGRAAGLLHQFLGRGESEQMLLGMLVYQFRNLIIIKDLLARGASNQEIIKKTKISPFVFNKNLALAKKRSLKNLILYYDQIRRTDSAIKSGDMAPVAAIDILVSTLTSGN